MRLVPVLCLASSLSISTPASLAAGQDHHGSSDQRGGIGMGFDQALTTHHFLLFNDGGAIEVSVNDVTDTKNRDAIRSHLPHIAMMFGEGNFEAPMLVHDSKNVPGTKAMTARTDAIRYQYVETAKGGRVDIVTSDAAALAAVHQFLTFQIAEHKTGDPTTARTR
jgi:hypothetical protein